MGRSTLEYRSLVGAKRTHTTHSSPFACGPISRFSNFTFPFQRMIKPRQLSHTLSFSRLLIGSLMSIAIAIPAVAEGWWNSEWTARKKFTVDTTATGVSISESVGTTAVLVRLYDG